MEGNSDLLYRCVAVIAGKSSNSLTFGGVRAKVVQNSDLERHLHRSQVYMWVRSLLGRQRLAEVLWGRIPGIF